jgi:hypothetical protein
MSNFDSTGFVDISGGELLVPSVLLLS